MRYMCLMICFLSYAMPVMASSNIALKELGKRLFRSAPKSAGVTLRGINQQLAKLSSRYGDDGIRLARLAGHRGLKVMVNASDDAGRKMMGLFRRMGHRAVPVIKHAASRKLFLRYGDVAADAMMRHPGLAGSVITKYGEKGAQVINRLKDKGARRLTRLFVRNKALARNGDQYLDVVQRYGNKGLQFIWDHKAALAVTTIGVTFLNDPEPYINGTVQLASVPLKGIAWNWIVIPIAILLFLGFGGMALIKRIRNQAKGEA